MGASQTGTKILIAVLGAAVIGLGLALYLATRPTGAPVAAPVAPLPVEASDRGQSSFGRAAPMLRGPDRPPARTRNELGQPLNEDGRPIGPPEKLAAIRNQAVEPGEVPTTPPLFTDPVQRAAFKRWWVDEMARRAAIYQQLEPGDGYPAPDELARLLDEFYDASEPRLPGESVEQAIERRRRWQALWQRFLDTYGATPQTISSRGGDPQYGETPAPPVQPPGIPDPDVPPAPAATETPPGRGAGDPQQRGANMQDGAERAR